MSARSRASLLLLSGFLASACESGPSEAKPSVSAPASSASPVLPIEVVGTQIVVRKPDGSQATTEELIGAVLLVSVDGSPPQQVRIDAVEADPKDKSGEVLLYVFSSQDATTGRWSNVCPKDPQGLQRGFPLAGSWNAAGNHVKGDGVIELSCTSGAVGKCLRMGYLPWKSAQLSARHQACTRMLRADYCGNGTSYTKTGTLINVYDPAGIQPREPVEGLDFEAAWGPDGAVCVRRTRLSEVVSLDDLVRACPRLAGKTGETCSEEVALADPKTLVLNASKPQ